MFDIFAKLLSSVATFLFPVFASYKALKTSDPALLTPWLMYWVVLACTLLVESWTEFILVWIPFYAWIRAFFLLWLIAPQTQGAKQLYQNHVHPFLREHEIAIDEFISSAHDRAKEAGLKYVKQAIEFVKENVLGLPPQQPVHPPPPSNLSYAQSLIARFNLPSSRSPSSTTATSNFGNAATSTATDFYTLLASAVSAATSASFSTTAQQPQTHDLSNSGTLIPPTISGTEERISFIAAQRERLSILLSALDREAKNIQQQSTSTDFKKPSPRDIPNMLLDGSDDGGSGSGRPASAMSGMANLSKSRSETDFEKIDSDVEGTEEFPQSHTGSGSQSRRAKAQRQTSSGSWLPWSWGASHSSTTTAAATASGAETDVEVVSGNGDVDVNQGKSSGVEL